jgi:hypothetical protein
MSHKESMLAMLRRERSVLEEKMLALEKIPDEDTYEDGAMIKVVVDGRRRLTYLLLKIVTDSGRGRGRASSSMFETRWYYTGSVHRVGSAHRVDERWMSWDQLQTWLGQMGLESWEELTAKPGASDDVVG